MGDEPTGNGANGKKLFTRNCASCHNTSVKGKHAVGPILGTVWGRKIASVSGFKFTSALGTFKGNKWGKDNLEKWIANPAAFASGTSMAFAGIKSEKEREDLIRYLWECHPKNKKK